MNSLTSPGNTVSSRAFYAARFLAFIQKICRLWRATLVWACSWRAKPGLVM
jgi:hypothetical protein